MRNDDRLVGALIARLEIYMTETAEWRTAHDASAKDFRDDINKRLIPVEDWVKNANWSWKLAVGIIAFTGIIFKSLDWIRIHFK